MDNETRQTLNKTKQHSDWPHFEIELELLRLDEYEDFFADYKQIGEEDLKGIKLG